MQTSRRKTMKDAIRATGVTRTTILEWHRRGLFAARRDWRGGLIFTAATIERVRELTGVGDASCERAVVTTPAAPRCSVPESR
jgi:hypothetical protein